MRIFYRSFVRVGFCAGPLVAAQADLVCGQENASAEPRCKFDRIRFIGFMALLSSLAGAASVRAEELPIFGRPVAVVMSDDGGSALIANQDLSAITVIESHTLEVRMIEGRWSGIVDAALMLPLTIDGHPDGDAVTRIPLGFPPKELLALPDHRFLVADAFGGHVVVVDAPSGAIVAAHEETALGATIFRERACIKCHDPDNDFTSPQTYDVAVHDETGTKLFNPPSLRGLRHRRTFFHDARFRSLDDLLQTHPDAPAPGSVEDSSQLKAFLMSL